MPIDIDRHETHEDLERSQQNGDQGTSTRKPDSISSCITQDDFITARNVAYGCLSAIEELSLASGDLSTLIHETRAFESDDLALRPADKKLSRITRAVEYLCQVLDNTGVEAQGHPFERDRIDRNSNDAKRLGKISKVEHWLLVVSPGRTGQTCKTAHENALRLALDMWSEIETLISLKSCHERGSYEPGPGFRLELELIEENAEKIRERIRNRHRLNYEGVWADVKNESAKAFAAWKPMGYAVPGKAKRQTREETWCYMVPERFPQIKATGGKSPAANREASGGEGPAANRQASGGKKSAANRKKSTPPPFKEKEVRIAIAQAIDDLQNGMAVKVRSGRVTKGEVAKRCQTVKESYLKEFEEWRYYYINGCLRPLDTPTAADEKRARELLQKLLPKHPRIKQELADMSEENQPAYVRELLEVLIPVAAMPNRNRLEVGHTALEQFLDNKARIMYPKVTKAGENTPVVPRFETSGAREN